MRHLAKIIHWLVRWAARQVMTSALVFLGLAIGWFGRRAMGPMIVSESLGKPATPMTRATRPLPVVPSDSAARVWAEEAAGLTGPNDSLRQLRSQLDAGALSDFGRLARSLLCHPLRRFRSEAFAMLIPAWTDTDPESALRFLIEYQLDVQDALADGSARAWAVQAHYALAANDPAAAIRIVTPEIAARMDLPWLSVLGRSLRTEEGEGRPSVIDRMRLIASVHGEAVLWETYGYAILPESSHRGQQVPFRPAAEWRQLASEVSHTGLKWKLTAMALRAWSVEMGPAAGLEKARAWFNDPSPQMDALLASYFNDGPSVRQLLQSKKANELSDWQRSGLVSQMMADDLDLALSVCRDPDVAERVDPKSIANASWLSLDESKIRAWLEALPQPHQRETVLEKWLGARLQEEGPGSLAASVHRAMEYGETGDPAAVALMTRKEAAFAQQVPDIFGSLPAEVQSRLRFEVVVQLGFWAPDVAAEIWMDATPEELAEPGAVAVAEELTGRLLNRAPDVASAWIQQLPLGGSRDRAVARLIERMAKADPATCLEWAATIVDPKAQARAQLALDSYLTAPATP